VLKVIYAIDEPSDPPAKAAAKLESVFVGQQVDVFIDGNQTADARPGRCVVRM
jgi:hypothetical protein